jgi:hypothetical protein
MTRTGSLSRQIRGGGMRRGKVNTDPLRKVVGEDGDYETLECGHTILARFDLIGRTYADRRRCWKCKRPDPGGQG